MSIENKVPAIRFKGFSGEWEDKKFKDIVANLSGGASIAPSDYQKDGKRTIPKGAVNATGIADLSGSKYISLDFYEKNILSKVSSEELVTSLRDLVPTAPNMGRVVKIKAPKEDFLMPQGVYKIALEKGVDENFVIAYSNSEVFRKIISREKNGSTQVHIRNGEFLDIEIIKPKHEEQTKIGNYFQQLDTLIAQHQQKHDKLLSVKKALLEKMFPKQGATVPEIRFKGVSGEWAEKKLYEVCQEFQSGCFIKAEAIKVEGAYPVYGGNGLRGYTDSYNYDGTYALIGRQGALCGNMGISKGKAYFTEHAIAVRANNYGDTTFLFYLLGIMKLGQYSGQSAQPGLAVNKLIELIAYFPASNEQTKIGNLFKQLDTLITQHQAQLKKLGNIKQACLEKMFV